jgi:hypothetical protein
MTGSFVRAPAQVPAFVREHAFALSPSPSSPALLRAHRHASAALASLSAHGAAVALAVAVLQTVAAAGNATMPLPRLRRALVAVLAYGTSRNAAGRAELRRCVARVVFADAASPRPYCAAVDVLEALAADGAIRDEAWRLKSVAKAARDVLRDVRAAHDAAPLSPRVWADIDSALAHAVESREEYRGGEMDAACAELVETTEALVLSAQIGTRTAASG